MASADVGVSVNAVETVLKKAQSAPSSVSSGCTILRVVYIQGQAGHDTMC